MNNSPRFLIPTQMIIIQAIGLITANKSLTDHVATDNSADNDDSDTSSYVNSLGNKYIYQNITPEFHYQNFSADTNAYQQVSLSVTSERTNEIVNYIAFAFVYGYNENKMTVDNAEVNLLKVKLNQSCGKAKM